MVKLTKIYTRTGDSGTTGLVDGSRRSKAEPRMVAIGEVDEANSAIGVALLAIEGALAAQLTRIQNDLFDLGADLCRPGMEHDAEADHPPLRLIASQVDRLESEIDTMNANLAPLRSFVLPGGSALAAYLHLCRTVARRAERLSVELNQVETINDIGVKYLNRLSDWFFVASRVANNNGADDVLWVPGANR